MIRRADDRWKALVSALLLAPAVASCALVFPDYELEDATSGGGGAGGMATGGSGAMTASPDGSPCSSDDDCENDACLRSNTGEGRVCCATECPDLGASNCSTNGKCDARGGSCALYRAGTPCSEATSCDAGLLTVQECQMGACEDVSNPCDGGLVCADETTCKTECVSNADCQSPDAECPSGQCVQPLGSACSSDDQCMSGICGATGEGHCCAALCDPVNDPRREPCGAIDCDEKGACVFPETACGETSSCSNANLTSDYCDGTGQCSILQDTEPCPEYLACADETSCHEACGSNDTTGDARCRQGFWCDGTTCVGSSIIPGFPCSRGAQCASGICTALGCYL